MIYNTLISEMYKVYTGKAKQAVSVRELARGIQPGLLWCFGRESVAMGLGLCPVKVAQGRLAQVPGPRGEDEAQGLVG